MKGMEGAFSSRCFVRGLMFTLLTRRGESAVDWLSQVLTGRQGCQARGCHWSWEGEGCFVVGLRCYSPERQYDVGCVWMKKLTPSNLPGQISRAKENHIFPIEGLTRWPFRIPANSRDRLIGNGHYFFPTSTSSQSKSLRESKLLQLPPHRAFGGLPGGWYVGKMSPGMPVAGGISLERMSWGSTLPLNLARAASGELWHPLSGTGLHPEVQDTVVCPPWPSANLCWHSECMDTCPGASAHQMDPCSEVSLTFAMSNRH